MVKWLPSFQLESNILTRCKKAMTDPSTHVWYELFDCIYKEQNDERANDLTIPSSFLYIFFERNEGERYLFSIGCFHLVTMIFRFRRQFSQRLDNVLVHHVAPHVTAMCLNAIFRQMFALRTVFQENVVAIFRKYA